MITRTGKVDFTSNSDILNQELTISNILMKNNNDTDVLCYHCFSSMELFYQAVNDKIFWNEGEWSTYICKKCNLLSLYPPPTPEELGKYYQTYYTHIVEKSYLRRKVDVFSNYVLRLFYLPKTTFKQKVMSLLLPNFVKKLFTYEIFHLRQKDGVDIFDVGFGNGNFIAKMVSLNVNPSGCDFDPRCVELVQKKYNLQVYHGALSEITTDKNYNIITYGHVVEHLYSLKEELLSARKKLKPKGKVVGLTPNIESFGHLIFKQNWRGLEPPRHLHIYSMSSIKKIAEQCGYKVLELKTTARYARHILAASIMIRLNRKASVSGGGRGIWIASCGYLLQVIEWGLNLFKKNLGEEIYFVLELDKNEY